MMNNLFDLTGKVALVTGASSGLGVQFAKALARQGADIAICARRVEKLEAVKKEIEAIGVKVFCTKCDVTDNADIARMVNEVVECYGKIDILVNNAGVGDASPAAEMTDETWRKVIGTNLDAVYFVAREEAGLTRAQASELIGTISESRLEKLETGKTAIVPEDVVDMALAYKKPELCKAFDITAQCLCKGLQEGTAA